MKRICHLNPDENKGCSCKVGVGGIWHCDWNDDIIDDLTKCVFPHVPAKPRKVVKKAFKLKKRRGWNRFTFVEE